MKIAAVIPARYASTRFPGKPLTDVGGKPMVQVVYEQAVSCSEIDVVFVATDDERIRNAVETFGGKFVMTSPECASGTDRVAEAAKQIEADVFINVQGDQVLLDVSALNALAKELRNGASMVTIATNIEPGDENDPNIVKVVCSVNGNALYFSRATIPFVRNAGYYGMLKHVGIYGFSRKTLNDFTSFKPSPLELTESLEQLRALENGIQIKVIKASGRFHEINTPEDKVMLGVK